VLPLSSASRRLHERRVKGRNEPDEDQGEPTAATSGLDPGVTEAVRSEPGEPGSPGWNPGSTAPAGVRRIRRQGLHQANRASARDTPRSTGTPPDEARARGDGRPCERYISPAGLPARSPSRLGACPTLNPTVWHRPRPSHHLTAGTGDDLQIISPRALSMDPISITTGIITLFAVIRKIQRFRRDVAEAGNLLRDLERDCTLTLDLIRNCKRNLDRLELIMGGSFIYDGDDIRKKLTKIIQELDPDLKALGREIARLALEPQNRFELWRNAARRALPLPSKLSDKHKEIVKKRKEFEKLQSALDS